jgi:HSP20 family molecular chaperone IbpA
MARVPIRIGTTILDDIEKAYDDITKRAYEIFLERRGAYTLDFEDWLTAENQLLWKPDFRVVEKRGLFVVRVDLKVVDPATVDILVTTEDVLVQSGENPHHPRVFRAVHFPAPINPFQLHATYVKGTLILIAPKIAVRSVLSASR